MTSAPSHPRTVFEIEASESRYRNLIQFIPIPLWQVDARAAGLAFAELKAAGVADLDAYLDTHPELIEFAKDTVVVSDAKRGRCPPVRRD
jgi:two-component system, LuxR family, sensor kinase FixL